eukprot:GHVN01091954.1.p1 GENE.GHVN01091954.1~~GHVN01091954.1.p1  ORF type:complete len:105 (+),score=8.94 GHVN01091954.1:73-387(+)
MAHTIVMVQFSSDRNSRTYMDYESETEAFDGVCQLYEQALKVLNPGGKDVSYEILDLYRYIDNLADFGILVYDSQISGYVPHDKNWAKTNVFLRLKNQVSQPRR